MWRGWTGAACCRFSVVFLFIFLFICFYFMLWGCFRAAGGSAGADTSAQRDPRAGQGARSARRPQRSLIYINIEHLALPAKVRDVRRRREAKPQARRCGFVAVSPGDRAFCTGASPRGAWPRPCCSLWGSVGLLGTAGFKLLTAHPYLWDVEELWLCGSSA